MAEYGTSPAPHRLLQSLAILMCGGQINGLEPREFAIRL